MKKLVITVISITLLSIYSFGQGATLNLNNIRNNEGQFQVAIFQNQDQFKSEEPISKLYFDKKDVIRGRMDIDLDLEPGTYGITILDDEDMSEDLTYRLGIYPKEGVGFSNYVLKGMTKPSFSDFQFEVSDEHSSAVIVELKYF